MRTVVLVAVLVVIAFAMAMNVLDIGKPSKPTTPGTALGALILNGAIAAAVIYLWA